jgi:hypothetical protein
MQREMHQMREEEGERSNRMPPRRYQLKKFENLGFKIKESK